MAILDVLSDVGEKIWNYPKDRWNGISKTFTGSWAHTVPDGFMSAYSGALTIAQSPWRGGWNDTAHGLGLWLDGLLGMGSGVLGGTLGTVLEAPILHETMWGLDKVYRYGVARPYSWLFYTTANSALAADDARKRGDDPHAAYLSSVLSGMDPFGNDGVFSENVGKVTPGQAMMWAAGGVVGQINPGNAADKMSWLRSHDPRTTEGQATYNSPDALWYLKYGSGSVDAAYSIFGDPTDFVMPAGRAIRSRFSNIATADYIAKGGVEKEISTKGFERTYAAALKAKTPEAFRMRVMPNAPLGGAAAYVLHAAAQIDKPTFRDAYVVARGMDGLRMSPATAGEDAALGRTAWERLVDRAPQIGSDMARIFANWNIGEDALNIGRNPLKSAASNSLALNDVDAFISSMVARRGIWGDLSGSLMNTAQPNPTLLGALSQGVHSWAMTQSKVHVGRRLVRPFLPSQGYSAFLDSEDASALALRQFKANLERSGMDAGDVEKWVSQWAGKTTREGRNAVWERSHEAAIRVIAEQSKLPAETVAAAMPELMRHKDAARQIVNDQRIYLTERVNRRGVLYMNENRKAESAFTRVLSNQIDLDQRKGGFGKEAIVMQNVDGHTNIVQIPDTRRLSNQGAKLDKPLLLSQTETLIPTYDYRALRGALRWWKWQHPPEMVRLASGVVKIKDEAGPRYLNSEDGERVEQWAPVPTSLGRWTLSKAALTRNGLEHLITATDFANMVWKTSALLRPAQTPRNLADDVFRRLLIFDKLPLLMSLQTGTRRMFQNAGIRGRLVGEMIGEQVARRRADGTTVLRGTASTDSHAPRNPKPVDPKNPDAHLDLDRASTETYGSVSEAWRQGAIGLADFTRYLDHLYNHKTLQSSVPAPIRQLINAKNNRNLALSKTMGSRGKTDLPNDSVPRATPRTIGYGAPAEKPKVVRLSQAENKREYVRRLIMYYFGDQLTRFLDDRRIPGVSDRATMRNSRLREQGYDPAGMIGPEGDARRVDHDERAAWIERLIGAHEVNKERDMRPSTGEWEDGARYRAGQIIVDPMTGLSPRGFNGSLEGWTIIKHHNLNYPLTKGGDVSGTASNVLENFILDNIDELLKPDQLLSMSIDPVGNIRMGVVKARPETAEAMEIKVSAKRRMRDLKIDGIQDAGHERFQIQVGDDLIEFGSALGGEAGEPYMHRLLSSEGNGSTNYLLSDVSARRLQNRQGGWGVVQPNHRGYAASWERAVNAQLAGDPVARKFLEGWTNSDVIHWVENTDEGTRYLYRMKHHGVNYVDHIHQIEAMVDEYVPLQDSNAGRTLRQAVLERKAERSHLDAVVPARGQQPEVHGASIDYLTGRGDIFKMVTRGIDNAQRLLSDLPTDKASRIPFFAESYRRHLTDMVRIADFHASKTGDVVPLSYLDQLEGRARERALYDTKYHLYDVAQVNDLARLSRFIVPFSSAITDSYIKYGRIVKENPAAVLRGLYYWQVFERNESVQDENGYVMRYANDGSEHWYMQDPKTGEMTEVPAEKAGTQRYVQFRLPSDLGHWVGKKIYGTDMQPVVAINKKTFNVFIDLPASGPFVAIPANEFALSHPEFSDTKFVKQFVLPFGPSAGSYIDPNTGGKTWMPSTVRAAWETFAGEDGDKAEGQAKAIYQAELISYARHERGQPPSFAEVRAKAGMMQKLRFLTAFGSPVSFQVQSPYQPYIDTYRQMANADPKNADEMFLHRYGDEFYAVAMATTRNVAGIRASLESYKAFEARKELIAAYPDLSGLIVGLDGGAFSKSVYEAQKEETLKPGTDQKVREVMSLDDSVRELEKRRVWSKYSQLLDVITSAMADRGLRTLRGARAKDLASIRDKFVEANRLWIDPASGREVPSPWFEDFSSVDHNKIQNRIEAMAQIVKDPDLQKLDYIRGLIDYLQARQTMQLKMQRKKVRTLDSVKAKRLAEEWADQSFALTESNVAFAAVWNRYLSTDDKLQIPARGVNASY